MRKAEFFLELLAVLLFLCPSGSSADIYYVTPDQNTSCPTTLLPCLTLSQYAQAPSQYFTSNRTTFLFLAGDHILSENITVSSVVRLSLIGGIMRSPTSPETRIVCNESSTISFTAVSRLQMVALIFSFCGTDNLPAITVTSADRVTLDSCAFDHSLSTAFVAMRSNLTFQGTTLFDHNAGGGLTVSDSNIELLGRNNFQDNIRSGISVDRSELTLSGATLFVGNSNPLLPQFYSCYSAGIQAHNSMVNILGECTFANNTGPNATGAVCIQQTTLQLSGRAEFVNNSGNYAGGIFVQDSVFNCTGQCNFIQNSGPSGAAIYALTSTINMDGNAHFQTNSALGDGGAISATDCTLILTGTGTFVNNFAGRWGGVILLGRSSLTCTGTYTYTDNTAVREGGAIITVGNKGINCSGEGLFARNYAQRGGAIRTRDSSFFSWKGDVHFTDNSARYNGGGISGQVYLDGTNMFTNNTAILGSGGGVYASQSVVNGTNIFIGNFAGDEGGGISIFEGTISGQSKFTCNRAENNGGGLSIRISGTTNLLGINLFERNSALYGGAVFVAIAATHGISGSSIFRSNSASFGGGGIFTSRLSRSSINGNATALISNSANFGGAVMSFGEVNITGSAVLLNNTAFLNGGGITTADSDFVFDGEVEISENSALSGGGMYLATSTLYILPNTTVYFQNNYAMQQGGAIFVEDPLFIYCSNRALQDRNSPQTTIGVNECFFQPTSEPIHRGETFEEAIENISLVFDNNTAEEGGNALFGGIVDSCVYLVTDAISGIERRAPSNAIFDAISNFIGDTDSVSRVSSQAYRICPCLNGKIDCSETTYIHEAYPGETLSVPLVAVGQQNGAASSVVIAYLNSPTTARFGEREDVQSVTAQCSLVPYTLLSRSSSESFLLYSEAPCGTLGEPLLVNVTLLPCPTGFQLSRTSSSCVCADRLQKYTQSCNIADGKIERDGEFWIGVEYKNDSEALLLSPHCPFDYCKSTPIAFSLNNSDLQCNYNRTGILCGSCASGLSLTLGTSRCAKCSNHFLALLIPFALAGIGLVLLLFVCKLTVAIGTINGVIFYANIVGSNSSLFFPTGQTNILTVFVAWVNLDLGIEACFISDLDAYIKTWLQFVFPLYLWVLVGLIILSSNFSLKIAKNLGKNPIAVLTTIFLLSYTKLLRTSFAALSLTFVEYPNDTQAAVWVYDGSVGFLEGKHIPLFLVAIATLLTLFLPYTLLLFGGQWLQAHSSIKVFSWIENYKLRGILDPYYAPYKSAHRYRTGLLLLVRLLLLLIFVSNALGDPSVNLLAIACVSLCLATLTWLTGAVYRKWYLDVLEASFTFNLGILAAATYYVRGAGGSQAAVAYTSVGIAFATFTGIIVYHLYFQIRNTLCKCKAPGISKEAENNIQYTRHREELDNLSTAQEPPKVPVWHLNVVELREPLLEET